MSLLFSALYAIQAEPGAEDDEPALIECGVCMDDCEADKISANRCGHWFCNECWATYIESEVGEGRTSMQCMESDCGVVVPDSMVQVAAWGLASLLDSTRPYMHMPDTTHEDTVFVATS